MQGCDEGEEVHRVRFLLDFFFKIVVRTQYEMFPFNKLVSTQCSIVNYRHNVIQQISKIYSSCVTETIILNSNSPFLPPSSLGQPLFHSLFSWFYF